jgi:hypothetical protein
LTPASKVTEGKAFAKRGLHPIPNIGEPTFARYGKLPLFKGGLDSVVNPLVLHDHCAFSIQRPLHPIPIGNAGRAKLVVVIVEGREVRMMVAVRDTTLLADALILFGLFLGL